MTEQVNEHANVDEVLNAVKFCLLSHRPPFRVDIEILVAEIAHLREERDELIISRRDGDRMFAEIKRLRVQQDQLVAALKMWMSDYYATGEIGKPAFDAAHAAITAVEEKIAFTFKKDVPTGALSEDRHD